MFHLTLFEEELGDDFTGNYNLGGKSVGFMVRNFSFVGPTLERVWFDVHYSTQHGAKKRIFKQH